PFRGRFGAVAFGRDQPASPRSPSDHRGWGGGQRRLITLTHCHRPPRSYRLALLVTQHERIASQLAAEQVRLFAILHAIYRRLNSRREPREVVAASLWLHLLRLALRSKSSQLHAGRVVGQRHSLQVNLVTVYERPPGHCHCPAAARDRGAAL